MAEFHERFQCIGVNSDAEPFSIPYTDIAGGLAAIIEVIRHWERPILNVDLNLIFGWAGNAAMLGWVVLVFLPRRWKLLNFLPQFIIPFGLSILYTALVLPAFASIEGGGYGSLEQVKVLFSNDTALLGGWVHYLAFDLFIGAWIAAKADEVGISRILQAPILLATFMFGPLGLVLFLSMRGFYKKEITT